MVGKKEQTARNILIAFLVNLFFAVFELVGGALTNSIAIMSDAIHDAGDAIGIGISYFLERKSRKRPDAKHTFGYARYSILGALIATTILAAGACLIIYAAVQRILTPDTAAVNAAGMIVLAIVGVIANGVAVFVTRGKDSLNQRSVNLHMMEDALGWMVVLIGAVVMLFVDFPLIDPLMSIGVAIYILIEAGKNFRGILDLFLEKTPDEISTAAVKRQLKELDGVEEVHHLHLWSLDGEHNYATMHVVTDARDVPALKVALREKMAELGVGHTTIEIEMADEDRA